MKVVVHDDAEALHDEAAARISRAAERSIADRGAFAVVLTGGTTVRPVYERLRSEPGTGRIAWDRVDVFFTDERCVPPDHPDSNFGMVREALLDHVPIPRGRIHRMAGEDPDPARAATAYERRLRHALGIGQGDAPRFDLMLLGMGADGHVASLFPGGPEVFADNRLVVAVDHDGDPPPAVDRLSLTAPALNAGRETVFLVAGGGKAAAVRAVLRGPRDPARLPAQRIDPPTAPATWLLDRPAAAALQR